MLVDLSKSINCLIYADVVESADTTDLKSVGRDTVRVQVPSSAGTLISMPPRGVFWVMLNRNKWVMCGST